MKVVIYGKDKCVFCNRAKDLVKANNIDHEYIDIIETGLGKEGLEKIVGIPISTVPQIFVDGKHIGGYVDLVPIVNRHVKPVEDAEVETEDPNMNYFIRERGEGGWSPATFKQYLSANSRYEMDAKKEPK